MRTAVAIIPTLNEDRRIGSLLDQLIRLPADLVPEILVTDGRSTDKTRAIVAQYAARDRRVRLVDNPARLQAAGLNAAVHEAQSAADTIMRIDAHAAYPDNFVPRVLAVLDRTGADMAAVRLVTRGETCLQRGIAAAMNSRLGTGGSAHRVGGFSGFVDHGHHAGMDRTLFERIGGYDPGFVANEDAEFDYRARQAGARIWLEGTIEVGYYPRRTLRALLVQYRRYGVGRARTFLKHRERLRVRQVLPPAASTAIVACLLLGLLSPWFLAVPAAYAALLAAAATATAVRTRDECALAAAPAMAIMHVAWGIAFAVTVLAGLARPGGSRNGGAVPHGEAE